LRKVVNIKEDLLHLVWKLKKFDFNHLKTTDGQDITISKFGFHNHNAGPDFLNGEVTIGETKWVGHIEMHIRASEWKDHKHHLDKAYNNVILHVVYQNDGIIYNENGQTIPTLILQDRISEHTLANYENLSQNLDWIPCAKSMHKVDSGKFQMFLEKVLIERLEDKCLRIMDILDHNMNDWEDTLYKLLSKYLGLKVNASAFEQLAHVTPYKTLKKVSSNLNRTEALLLGQSGLLSESEDPYISQLYKEHAHLQTKHDLIPMTGVEWKFARLRPANFPTIRMAQLAMMYHHNPQLFSKIMAAESIADIRKLLDVQASEYWDTHYIPEKESEQKIKKIGLLTQDLIIINVVIPLLFSYGIRLSDARYKENAIDILRALKSENNSIIRKWKSLGVESESAYVSQALLQLKNQYCSQFKCLSCHAGQEILFS